MKNLLYILMSVFFVVSCTETYQDDLPEYEPELVVEAYLSSLNPALNYALLSKSIDFYNPDLDVAGIGDANVWVEEGKPENNKINWNPRKFEYSKFDVIDGLFLAPFTFVPREGFYYKMFVEYKDDTATATTYMSPTVEIDTLFAENIFNPSVDSIQPFTKMTFTDPDTFGNRYMLMDYRDGNSDWPLLWGSASRLALIDDDFLNGQEFSYQEIFPDKFGDTVNFFLASIDQKSYTFWESYENARNNGGPFSQPLSIKSNFEGAIGIFMGMGLSTRKIIIEKP